jgi:hypothetical protein
MEGAYTMTLETYSMLFLVLPMAVLDTVIFVGSIWMVVEEPVHKEKYFFGVLLYGALSIALWGLLLHEWGVLK